MQHTCAMQVGQATGELQQCLDPGIQRGRACREELRLQPHAHQSLSLLVPWPALHCQAQQAGHVGVGRQGCQSCCALWQAWGEGEELDCHGLGAQRGCQHLGGTKAEALPILVQLKEEV
jgi:hypothetical protein